MKYLFLLRRLPLLLLSVISGFSSFSQNAFFEVLANESSRSNYTVKPAIQKYSLFRLDEEALCFGLKGEKKHQFLCAGLGCVPGTSPKRLTRLRAEFKSRRLK